jgi:hypothetical protein
MPNHIEEGRDRGAGEVKWWLDIPLAVAVMWMAMHQVAAEGPQDYEVPPTPTPIIDIHAPTPTPGALYDVEPMGRDRLAGGSTFFE